MNENIKHIIRDRLRSLAQTAEHLAENLDDTGRPLYDYEKQVIVAATLPSLEECFRMMIGNLVLGNNRESKDHLDTIMADVIALTDL